MTEPSVFPAGSQDFGRGPRENRLARYKSLIRRYGRYLTTPVSHRSLYEAIYHCCTQKTASQWFVAVLDDPIVYRHSGLRTTRFAELGLRYADFRSLAPKGMHLTLYCSYPSYREIRKPARYRTFFVMRDPRDILVSWYFSARFSHPPLGPIPGLRAALQDMEMETGINYVIDRLLEWQSFQAQRTWTAIAEDERDKVRVFKYEDLASDNRSFLKELLSYLDIPVPDDEFEALCERKVFEKLSGGRRQGIEQRNAHYRKGLAGDWRNHLTPGNLAYFRERTGDLLSALGYEE